ncbi:cell wall hydrolase [Eubacterium multiforme]|uniref:N-acetylmuramoyl-L-alanine amidase n=1 Tax=Eubacterium multiforme TaxID=83339 RepID=A0ABT9UUA2_9FIRM|nr:cell wall hydrolase [Eubacterium multiforme]MDQ0149877.1 N-acetylmuramoyl-L-alanine amidase [Eubacterium multiforme]
MKKFISLFLLSMMLMSSVEAKASMLSLFDYISLTEDIESIDKSKNNDKPNSKNEATKKEKSSNKNEVSKNNIEVFNQKGTQLKISRADIDLMAKLVYCESRGEPFKGKVAVASVVLNRVMSPKFPNTITDVIFQRNAFSCVQNGKLIAQPNESCYDAVYEAIRGKDPTNEALFFYNPAISTCSWMKETAKKDSKRIGNHTFFKQ